MNTESKVAQALDGVIAPYRSELQMLTPGERMLLAGELGQICRLITVATERASRAQSGMGEESLADTLQDHANFEMLLKQDQTADRGNLPDDSDAADSGEDSSKDKEQDTQPPPSKSKKGRRCGRPKPKRIRTGPPEDESPGT